MFLPPVECPSCGRTARPGEGEFQCTHTEIHCGCGAVIANESMDQRILSSNVFVRLGAASNHIQRGNIDIQPGRTHEIKFAEPFDVVSQPFLTPGGPIVVSDHFLTPSGLIVVSSTMGGEKPGDDPVRVNWLVYGLKGVDSLPTWRVLFYGAITHSMNGLYKPAVLDYAAAFEAFLDSLLNERLAAKYGTELARYLLKRAWRIEDRVKDVLELAIGHKLTEREDVYQPWFNHVKEPRDRLIHGDAGAVSKDNAESAHSAAYQAIRWTESLA